MDIAQEPEPDYDTVRIDSVGFVDPYGIEGLAVLRSDDGKEFHIKSFSGEVARHMAHIIGESGSSDALDIPSIYSMVSEICEANEVMLVKVKVYESGSALRSNIYLTGRKDIVLKNYRASDAITLAALYKIPILVRKNMLRYPDEMARTAGFDV